MATVGEAVAGSAWRTTIVGWHWGFYGVVALGLASAAVLDGLDPPRRVAAAALFLVLGVAYTVLVVPDPLNGRGWRTAVYLGLAVLATGTAVGLHSALSLLLFVVYPQAWLFTRSVRAGIAVTTCMTVSAVVGFLVSLGPGGGTLSQVLPSMLVSTGFSILLGWWVSRIIVQSRERAELIDELTAARARLAQAHHDQGVTAERERMAREIHDTLAQGFTSVLMLAQAASAQAQAGKDAAQVTGRLRAIEDVARENLAEARALVAAFSPVALDGSTLAEALQRLARRFTEQTGTRASVDLLDGGGQLQREHEVVLLRAVQEALTNVRRHARAGAVQVRLATDGAAARVEVDDDGVGFDPATAGADRGYGLAGMRGRVTQIGGDVEVSSAPGRGTRVSVRLPLAPSCPVAGGEPR